MEARGQREVDTCKRLVLFGRAQVFTIPTIWYLALTFASTAVLLFEQVKSLLDSFFFGLNSAAGCHQPESIDFVDYKQ